MSSEEAFAIWAPVDGPWSPWVKPVLFATEHEWSERGTPELPAVAEPEWLRPAPPPPEESARGYRDAGKKVAPPQAEIGTAYVLDLPGPAAVAWGMMLARAGHRPVPLYNALPGGYGAPVVVPPSVAPGTIGGVPSAGSMPSNDPFTAPLFAPVDQSALIDVTAIIVAMRRATAELRDMKLAIDLPPVFLLDADRRVGRGFVSPGRFDNRSVSLPTDFPSGLFLRSRNIGRAVLVQRDSKQPDEDLAHTLLGWQAAGVEIHAKSLADEEAPAKIEVTRPSQFRALMHRFSVLMGSKRHPLGGFGGTIPIPSAG